MSNKNPILFSFRRCPYAMRARMAIKLCKQTCAIREISLRSKHEEFLNLSQKGTVPVLLLPNGNIIDESLDIIKWAISMNDPFKLKSDDDKIYKEDLAIIKVFDDDFKFHLDRYKYSSRYENVNREKHRNKAQAILAEINTLLIENNWIRGDHPTLPDISVLPFVRQYRIADTEWFDRHLKLPRVKNWLNDFINSTLLSQVMLKYKIWEKGDPEIIL